MRQDQFEKLLTLSEKIADVVLVDANPEHWTGNGLLPKDLTKQERGDAYWCRKQAMASLSLLMRVHSLVGTVRAAGDVGPGTTPGEGAPDENEGQLDQEIAAAELEAGRLLDKAMQASRKEEFNKRAVNDKP